MRRKADAETLRAIRMARVWAQDTSDSPPVRKPPDPRLAICRGCHEAKACPNAVKGCCGGGYMFVYQVPCPHGRF